ncbi:DNA repair protein [Rhodococcus sp. AW25M09]|nr:DNA repair protein [Rhodococcus sp. AW25M09]
MQYSRTPLLLDAGNVGQIVAKSGGHQDRSRIQDRAIAEANGEAVIDSSYIALQNLSTEPENLLTSRPKQLVRCGTVAREEVVNMVSKSVARFFGVDDDHAPTCASQKRCGTESGGAAADHHCVIGQEGSSRRWGKL